MPIYTDPTINLTYHPPNQLEYILAYHREFSTVVLSEDEARMERIADLRTKIYVRLYQAIEKEDVLDPRGREILTLHFFYQVTMREIAAAFNTTVWSVHRAVKQATKKLRKHMKLEDTGKLLVELKNICGENTEYYY